MRKKKKCTKHSLTNTWVQKWVHMCPWPLTGHQFILESRDPPADIRLWDGFHKESPLSQTETVHRALSLVRLCQQQPQIPGMLQIHMRTLKQGRTLSEKTAPIRQTILLIIKPSNQQISKLQSESCKL